MATAAIGSAEQARIYHPPPSLGAVRARRALLGEVLLLLLCASLAAPAALVATSRAPGWLAVATGSHLARELSGYAALAVVVGQLSLAAGKRFRRLGDEGRRRWILLHRMTAPLLLLVVVLHTGGRAGSNFNLLLWGAFCALLALAQCGHVFKAWVRLRACSAASPAALALDEAANSDRGWVHLAGYQLHVVLAAVVTLLLAAHVFAVYWF